MQTILVTGHAGFIGSNLVKRLFQELKEGTIVGVDNLNDYYDPSLKEYRLQQLEKAKPAGLNYISIKGSIADRELVNRLFQQYQFDVVVNLAAQAGVRYSIENPDVYIESNIIGFYNILEACRHSMSDVRSKKEDVNAQPTAKAAIEREATEAFRVATECGCGLTKGSEFPLTTEASDARINSPEREQARRAASMVNGQCSTVNGKQSTANVQCSTLNVQYKGVQHLVYASSSSVYGGNKKIPFSTDDRVDNPVSLYAATKKSNELMAHCYSKLYNIPSTGLRFFTVYGPAGRPDMAYFGFTNKLLKGDTIQIFNYGNCRRDFTYVDDIVEGIWRVMTKAPARQTDEDGLPRAPYKVYNIGGGQPENLLDFVNILQEELVRAGVLPSDFDFDKHKQLVPMQPGDVPVTYADSTALERDFGFTPKITLREGLRKFAEWYKEYYG